MSSGVVSVSEQGERSVRTHMIVAETDVGSRGDQKAVAVDRRMQGCPMAAKERVRAMQVDTGMMSSSSSSLTKTVVARTVATKRCFEQSGAEVVVLDLDPLAPTVLVARIYLSGKKVLGLSHELLEAGHLAISRCGSSQQVILIPWTRSRCFHGPRNGCWVFGIVVFGQD